MAKLYPYITFENTKEALLYYETVFGATDSMRVPLTKEQAASFGLPEANAEDRTMHAMFTILGVQIMGADNFNTSVRGSSISIMIDLNSEDEKELKAANDFWNTVSSSGKIEIDMPFEEQFWGGKIGSFFDAYGIHWMLHVQPYSKIHPL